MTLQSFRNSGLSKAMQITESQERHKIMTKETCMALWTHSSAFQKICMLVITALTPN